MTPAKKPTTFINTLAASKMLNMSRKRFRRAAKLVGMEPIVFRTATGGSKFLYVRAHVESRAKELKEVTKTRRGLGVRHGPPETRRAKRINPKEFEDHEDDDEDEWDD